MVVFVVVACCGGGGGAGGDGGVGVGAGVGCCCCCWALTFHCFGGFFVWFGLFGLLVGLLFVVGFLVCWFGLFDQRLLFSDWLVVVVCYW